MNAKKPKPTKIEEEIKAIKTQQKLIVDCLNILSEKIWRIENDTLPNKSE